MDIKQAWKLLSYDSIPTRLSSYSLEEERNQDENYYLLRYNDALWEFCFVTCEKNSTGITEVLKTFKDEEASSKYFYLFLLSKAYFNRYIFPFEEHNKDINIGETNCSVENLKEAFKRLKIGSQYYSFNQVKKKHSIYLKYVGHGESSVQFIGENKKIIFETPIMENWLSYYAMYKFVYYLYLLDERVKTLQIKKKVDIKFTDEDYNVFML
ncbi:hypothetical protein ACFO4N_17720 [Camelliibacillus cellulosilyticus]|uniref:Uncharacterized protein n=1 Tax=Camelliibacillus cellulosilyticus TaxID=2174486 RepID=A0ABV9GR87_9BACL